AQREAQINGLLLGGAAVGEVRHGREGLLIGGHSLGVRRARYGVVTRLPQIVHGAARIPPVGKMPRQDGGPLPRPGAIPRPLAPPETLMQPLAPAPRRAVVEDIVIQAMAKAVARRARAIRPAHLPTRLQKLPPPR